MNKKHIALTVVLSMIAAIAVAVVEATDESPEYVNNQASEVGAVQLDTAPKSMPSVGRSYETRKIRVSNIGELLVSFGATVSTFTTAATSTNTQINDNPYTGSTATAFNPNVWQIATPSEPFHLDRLTFGGAGTAQDRIRIFDSRGDTSAVYCVFDITGSSLTAPQYWLNYDVSSGVTVMKGGTIPTTITGNSRHFNN